MNKLIRHGWTKISTSDKLRHSGCRRCLCQKYYDKDFGQIMYMDQFGIVYYRAPKCVLPNTKL